MNKTIYLILKFQRLFIPFCIIIFTIFLVMFTSTNLESAKHGLSIWVNSVVPTLFPFFIATELLGYTNIVYYLGKISNKVMKPIFNVPGEGSFPLIMGIISGYPVGSKIVSNLKKQGKITNIEAERLIAFTNNSGPLFILGTVGIGLFQSKQIGNILLVTHILAGLSTGIIFRWWKKNKEDFQNSYEKKFKNENKKEILFTNLGEILSISIINAIKTTMLIGGFIVLFSVVISMLENSYILKMPNEFSSGVISGILELTNGICKVSLIPNINLNIKVITCAFLLGFGGISILLQILSIISKEKISIKPYIIGKLLQGILAAVYTYIFIYFLQPLLIQ